MSGVLYCGDNLDVLNEYLPASSVDLIYLDPPFNSQRTYNIVYKDSHAQEEAFKDYWSWAESADTFERLTTSGETPKAIRSMLAALHELLVEVDSDQLAYLTMMTARLIALHRVLKPTGSLYLHCDPTASHYLKLILDALFGGENFQNEIIWKRTNSRSAAGRWPRVHDVLLFYSRSEKRTFEAALVPGDVQKAPHTLITGPDGKKYQTYELTAPNLRFGETGDEWRGFQPAKYGRCWANPPSVMSEWDRQGLIHWPKKEGAWPRRRSPTPYVAEARMVTVGDVWTDIDRINQSAKERLGYPTQKPIALLERIITASSKPNDLVLDPFCGCGTTIAACEKLGRRWVGIDIAHKAIDVIEKRFVAAKIPTPAVTWHPVDAQSARALATRDKRQFEQWVCRKLRARKRDKDRGIDGEAFFRDNDGKLAQVIISVKGGKLKPTDLRDLRGTIEREGAAIGVLVSVDKPSKEMLLEAARAKFLPISDADGPIPRLQLVRVDDEFFKRYPVRVPGVNVTDMPRADGEQLKLALNPAKPTVKSRRAERAEEGGERRRASNAPPPRSYRTPDPPLLKVAERRSSRPPSRSR